MALLKIETETFVRCPKEDKKVLLPLCQGCPWYDHTNQFWHVIECTLPKVI